MKFKLNCHILNTGYKSLIHFWFMTFYHLGILVVGPLMGILIIKASVYFSIPWYLQEKVYKPLFLIAGVLVVRERWIQVNQASDIVQED